MSPPEGFTSPTWELLRAKKNQALASSIPPEWRIPADLMPLESQADVMTWPETSGWFSEEELAITGLTATELVRRLAEGKVTSESVTRAFCKRACAAQQLTNCLSETCFDRALETARALDQHLARTGKPVGPLHGLPISLKDNFNLRGLDSTVGMTGHIDDPAADDSTLAQLLQAAGAVFYVKTNVPTAMMISETVNNLFGRTVNPRNRQTTSGGSSGGEASLITFGGSPLGIGTDIGGSLRIPAACTGIFTLRPSFGRFPTRNCRSGMPGQEAVQSVNGPLTTTLADLEFYCKSIVGSQPWMYDPKCLPIPWRAVDIPKRLKIGIMRTDYMVQPTPPVNRAINEVAQKLAAAGHEVVDWDGKLHAQSMKLLGGMFVADGGVTIKAQLDMSGEPMRPELKPYELARELGTSDMWKLQTQRSHLQGVYLDAWRNSGIDAILCPTTPYATTKSGTFKHVGYTGVFNLLDYSCVSFPTGLTVDKAIDLPDPNYQPGLSKADCQSIHDNYDAELIHGLPISLQLVAQRLEEEKVVAMTKRILQDISSGR